MAVAHLVFFRLDLSPEQEATLIEAFEALPGAVSELRACRFGRNRSAEDTHYTHGLYTEFADFDALKRYAVHPAHVALVQNRIKPVLIERHVVDYEIEEAASRN